MHASNKPHDANNQPNYNITNKQTKKQQAGVSECNVPEDNIFIKEVPGAYELPYAAKLLAMSGTVDAIICTGVLIKGETLHFEYISDAVTKGIMDVNLGTMTPVVYGVLNCLDEEQVVKRSSNENEIGRASCRERV